MMEAQEVKHEDRSPLCSEGLGSAVQLLLREVAGIIQPLLFDAAAGARGRRNRDEEDFFLPFLLYQFFPSVDSLWYSGSEVVLFVTGFIRTKSCLLFCEEK